MFLAQKKYKYMYEWVGTQSVWKQCKRLIVDNLIINNVLLLVSEYTHLL